MRSTARLPAHALVVALAAPLALASAACGTSDDDDNIPADCLVMTGQYGQGSPGSRPFTIDSIASACTSRSEIYLCHVGTFTSSSSSFQRYVADLSAVGPVADPFAGAQFFEANGELGYVCTEISRAPEIRACLASQMSCPSVDEADARIADNLGSSGVRHTMLR